MIEESVIREVIERTDIVRLVGEYVQLKRRGRLLVGLCPFHQEKTPSFHVNAERGIFKCFGCGVGGSAVDFLMRLEGRSFPEAIEQLAERLGIRIEHTRSVNGKSGSEARSREKAYYEIMRVAEAYFVTQLGMPVGDVCRQYAQHRGITDAMIASFGLGYAPDSWDGIVEDLQKNRQPMKDAADLGLIATREHAGGYYARFRNRLMFPVHNVKGEIIAFGGRVLDKSETAKYINSPESAIYTKGEHLYGLYQARMHIMREHCAILVEGNVDVVMMHGFGFCHTVASMGTALTPKQAGLLFRHTKRVYVMYDGDNAGRKAMCRALSVLLGYDFEGLYAVELPAGDDPDSYLRTYGADSLAGLIKNAQSLGMWCVHKKCQDILMLAPELRKSGFGELSELLCGFNDGLARRHYLEEAARYLGQDVNRLAVELGMELHQPKVQTDVSGVPQTDSQPYKLTEWTVVYMLLSSQQRYEAFMSRQGLELITEPALHALLSEYAAIRDKQSGVEVLSALSEASRQLYEKILCTELDVPDENLDKWYDAAVATLIQAWASRERRVLSYEIADAVKRNAPEEDLTALVEKDKNLLGLMMQTEKERLYCWHRNG